LCFYTTWQKRGNTKIAFSLKCCISVFPEINQTLLNLFNLFDSQLVLTVLYDSLDLVINAFRSGMLGEGYGLGERKSRAPRQLDCVARTVRVHQCALFLKEKKLSSVMCLIASNIC